ncbi:MAG: DUF2283 domain-containing protein [Planctomycetota bacterium]
MKLEYFADTDSLYVDFRDQPSVESAEFRPGTSSTSTQTAAWWASISATPVTNSI